MTGGGANGATDATRGAASTGKGGGKLDCLRLEGGGGGLLAPAAGNARAGERLELGGGDLLRFGGGGGWLTTARTGAGGGFAVRTGLDWSPGGAPVFGRTGGGGGFDGIASGLSWFAPGTVGAPGTRFPVMAPKT